MTRASAPLVDTTPENQTATGGGWLWPVLGLSVLWISLALLINPVGNFALNDDFAYGIAVRSWVEGGQLRFPNEQSAPLLPHYLWGSLASLPGGFSFTALRISTLVFGLIGVIGCYALGREFGLKPALAGLSALVLLANPLYLGLSYTFMSDVPFTA